MSSKTDRVTAILDESSVDPETRSEIFTALAALANAEGDSSKMDAAIQSQMERPHTDLFLKCFDVYYDIEDAVNRMASAEA